MKSFTDIEQSKKLAEFLPLETADMFYTSLNSVYPWIWIDKHLMEVGDIPCWSLAALLSVIKPVNSNTYTLKGTLDGGAMISFDEVTNVMFQEEEIIDAVFEMVIWLLKNALI